MGEADQLARVSKAAWKVKAGFILVRFYWGKTTSGHIRDLGRV